MTIRFFSEYLLPTLRLASRWAALRLRRNPPLAALLLHAGLLTAVYSALYCFGYVTRLPNTISLQNWDVGNLIAVRDFGYADPAAGYNAFFPLVPLIWRYTHLNMVEAAALSLAMASTGMYLLARTFGFNGRQTMLIASAPLLMFTMVPYTEGFFYFFGALLLCGLHRNTLLLTLIGLLGCCLTRSAGTLFVPAYLFAELLAWGSLSSGRRLLRNLLAGLAAIATSIGIVMLMQWQQGGDPLAFYKAHALWGHKFRWPLDYVNSSGGTPVLWLDALSLMVSLMALVCCAVLGLRWLKQRRTGTVQLPASKAVLFALGYSVGAGFFIVFYQAGDLVGMSRYLLATPFWAVLLAWVWRAQWTTRSVVLAVAASVAAVGLMVGMPTLMVNFAPGEGLWFFGLIGLYLTSYWLSRPDCCRWYREVATGLYFVNLFTLCFLLNLFFNNVWVN